LHILYNIVIIQTYFYEFLFAMEKTGTGIGQAVEVKAGKTGILKLLQIYVAEKRLIL